jgi:hypothetical protein
MENSRRNSGMACATRPFPALLLGLVPLPSIRMHIYIRFLLAAHFE